MILYEYELRVHSLSHTMDTKVYVKHFNWIAKARAKKRSIKSHILIPQRVLKYEFFTSKNILFSILIVIIIIIF